MEREKTDGLFIDLDDSDDLAHNKQGGDWKKCGEECIMHDCLRNSDQCRVYSSLGPSRPHPRSYYTPVRAHMALEASSTDAKKAEMIGYHLSTKIYIT